MDDSRGHSYEEIDLPSGKLRVTYVPDSWVGSSALRLQINDGGHLRQGPEIPVTSIGHLIGAIVGLVHPETPVSNGGEQSVQSNGKSKRPLTTVL